MKYSRSVLVVLLCLCPLMITFAAAPDPATKLLIALDADWSKAAVARDVDRVVSFYEDDAAVYPPNQPGVNGRANVHKVWAGAFADPSYNVSWKTTTAGIDNNTGWTAGTYEESYKDKDGRIVHGKGKYLCIWRKGGDGKWRAIHDMWNSDSK